LDTSEQARRLGLEELFDKAALTLIEWGERFVELMPKERVEVRMKHAGEDQRLIEVTVISLAPAE